jgi:hypothetical protein
MLSMVNANRFINMVAIPLVISAYGLFLLIDHTHNNESPLKEDHIQNIQKIGGVDGLLFGGSNAVYSLSAEFLSYDTGMKWYNASVLSELDTNERHKNFIQDLSARIDRTKVRYVVYSSIFPYQTGAIARHKSRENLGMAIKPEMSVLGYISRELFRHSEFPKGNRRNRFGDMVFENGICDNAYVEEKLRYEREVADISAKFLAEYAIFFVSLFPNASILIVLPSAYGALSFDDSIFEQTLRTKIYNAFNEKYFKNTAIKIIFQPPYSSITQVCDAPFHGNADGRLWRTRNLLERMREAVVATTQ